MKQIKTLDGSYTLYNKEFDEHYHTKSGALEEAFEKHVKAVGVSNGMKILDFCFGLGYNAIAAVKNHKNIEIIGLEIDKEILELIKTIEVPEKIEKEFDVFRKIADDNEIVDSSNNKIKLIVGDALVEIKKLKPNYFDRIFFDPFSPKKHAEMWTLDVFKEVYRVLKDNGKLSTYSCARIVRDNMKKAGFKVIDGPVIGRRSPSTIAVK